MQKTKPNCTKISAEAKIWKINLWRLKISWIFYWNTWLKFVSEFLKESPWAPPPFPRVSVPWLVSRVSRPPSCQSYFGSFGPCPVGPVPLSAARRTFAAFPLSSRFRSGTPRTISCSPARRSRSRISFAPRKHLTPRNSGTRPSPACSDAPNARVRSEK